MSLELRNACSALHAAVRPYTEPLTLSSVASAKGVQDHSSPVWRQMVSQAHRFSCLSLSAPDQSHRSHGRLLQWQPVGNHTLWQFASRWHTWQAFKFKFSNMNIILWPHTLYVLGSTLLCVIIAMWDQNGAQASAQRVCHSHKGRKD